MICTFLYCNEAAKFFLRELKREDANMLAPILKFLFSAYSIIDLDFFFKEQMRLFLHCVFNTMLD
jgi:hypothetical protein